MVYVNRNGQLDKDGGKLSWRRPVESFKEIWAVLILFFMSLFGPIMSLFSPTQSSSSSRFAGSSGSRGGSNGGNRRGGFRQMSDIRPPPMPFGGCSGGGCGM